MSDKVSDVTALCRSLMNDPSLTSAQAQLYTDALMIPFVASAFRDLVKRLAIEGVGDVLRQADLSLAAGVTQIGPNTVPPLPVDLVLPVKVLEKPSGASKFCPMTEAKGGLEDRAAEPTLQEWEFREGSLWFVGSTQAETVRVRFQRYFTNLAAATDPIPVPDVLDALAFLTAGMAARSRGVAELSKDMAAAYELQVESIINRGERPSNLRTHKPWWQRHREAGKEPAPPAPGEE